MTINLVCPIDWLRGAAADDRFSLLVSITEAEELLEALSSALEEAYRQEDQTPPLNLFKPSNNLNN